MHKNMHYKKIIIDIFAVTFREEGVDWNSPTLGVTGNYGVTFREEGVDWNKNFGPGLRCGEWVTFREEGVDWNFPSVLDTGDPS